MKEYTLMNPTKKQLKQRKLEEWSDALLKLFALLLPVIMLFAYSMMIDPFKPDLLIILTVLALMCLVAGIVLGKAAKACGKKTSKSR